MLPAYLGAFVNSDAAGGATNDGSNNGPSAMNPARRILRATKAGSLVTAGFVVVFGVIGAIVRNISSAVLEVGPWVTMVIGIVLVGLATSMLFGFQPKLLLPNPAQHASAKAGTLSSRGMFLYGISYAIVSLGCTLSIFLAQVGTSFTAGRVVDGVLLYIGFAVGMGLVVISLSIAVSLAQQSFVRGMQRTQPYIQRASAVLLLLAGSYVTYYGWYERAVRNTPSGQVRGSSLAESMFRFSDRARSFVALNSGVMIGVLAILVGLIGSALWRTQRGDLSK